MKIMRITLTAFLGPLAMSGLHASTDKTAPRAEVIFSNPQNFTDAADSQRGSEIGRKGNLTELRDHLLKRANSYVPEGQKLEITVTDVDLAGEIEPWRSPQAHDVRIIKDIYSPRIDLSYKLTDAATGAVIKEGTSQLRDLTFTMNLYANRTDPRLYEKGLLDDWLRKEFGRVKK